MTNVFDPEGAQELAGRIHALRPDARPLWGKMDVARMLAHCSVVYEIAYGERRQSPGLIRRFVLRTFVKPAVVGPKPYRRSLPTTSDFRIAEDRDFHRERERLLAYVKRTAELGESHFEGREHPNFGRLSVQEWNTLFYKHLDHHLQQFGV